LAYSIHCAIAIESGLMLLSLDPLWRANGMILDYDVGNWRYRSCGVTGAKPVVVGEIGVCPLC